MAPPGWGPGAPWDWAAPPRRSRRRLYLSLGSALLALIVAAVVTVVVVTSGSSSGSKPVSAAQLKAELLPLSDLPAGWTSTQSASPSGGSGAGAAGECRVGSGAQPGQVGRAAATFIQGQSLEFDEIITGFDTSGTSTYTTDVNDLNRCHSFTTGGTTFTLGRMSLPTIGNRSTAFQASTDVSGTSLAIDVVVAVKGDQVLLIGYTGLGNPDVTKLERLDRQAIARLP
jgi:hypothetical protein